MFPNNQQDVFRQQELMIWESMQQMGPYQFLGFLYQNPALLQKQDIQVARSNILSVVKLGIGTFIGGVVLNVAIKRFPIKFLDWPTPLRLLTRTTLFISPLALSLKPINKKTKEVQGILNKYILRLMKFKQTKRLMYLDPNGVLLPRPQ